MTLQQIEQAIRSLRSVDEMGIILTHYIRVLIPAPVALLVLFDYPEQVGEIVAQAGVGNPTHERYQIALEALGLPEDLQSGRPRLRHTSDFAPSILYHQLYPQIQIWLFIPLVEEGILGGIILLGHADPDFFTSAHLDLATEIGQKISTPVYNAFILESAEIARHHGQLLAGTSLELARLTSLRIANRLVMDTLERLVTCDSAAIVYRDQDQLQISIQDNLTKIYPDDAITTAFQNCIDTRLLPVQDADTAWSHPLWWRQEIPSHQETLSATQHWAAIPLLSGGQAIGFLVVMRAVGIPLVPAQIQQAEILAAQSGPALLHLRQSSWAEQSTTDKATQPKQLMANLTDLAAGLSQCADLADAATLLTQTLTKLQMPGMLVLKQTPFGPPVIAGSSPGPEVQRLVRQFSLSKDGRSYLSPEVWREIEVLGSEPTEGGDSSTFMAALKGEQSILYPLNIGGELIGAILVMPDRPGINCDTIAFCQLAGMGLALQRLRGQGSESERMGSTQLLDLVGSLAEVERLQTMGEMVLQALNDSFQPEAGRLILANASARTFELIQEMHHGVVTELNELESPIGAGWLESLNRLENNSPLFLSRTNETWTDAGPTQPTDCHSDQYIGISLQHDGRQIGAVELFFTQPKELSPAEADQLRGICRLTGHFVQIVRQQTKAQQGRRQAELLQSLLHGIHQSLDLQNVSESLLATLTEWAPVDSGALFAVNREKGMELLAQRPGGPSAMNDAAGVNLPDLTRDPILSQLLRHQVSVIVDDVHSQDRLPVWIPDRPSGSWLLIPLRFQEEVFGIFALSNDQPSFWHGGHRQQTESLVEQMASALHHALQYRQLQQAHGNLHQLLHQLLEAQEDERHHISHELHENIAQYLSGLSLTLKTMKALPKAEQSAELDRTQEVINGLITQVRHLAEAIRPPVLEDLGLVAALTWYFERFWEESGIQVHFSHLALVGRRLGRVEEITIFRIVQDALKCVARSAEPKEVDIHIWYANAILHIELMDLVGGSEVNDGVGGRKAGSADQLSILQERIRACHGQIQIRQTVNGDLQLTITIPVPFQPNLVTAPTIDSSSTLSK